MVVFSKECPDDSRVQSGLKITVIEGMLKEFSYFKKYLHVRCEP